MAKKSTTKPKTDMEVLDSLLETIAGQNEAIDQLQASVCAIQDDVEEQKSVIGVSGIDGSIAFQECLSAAIRAIVTSHNIFTVMRSDDQKKQMVNSIVDLAESLHVELTKRFGVRV